MSPNRFQMVMIFALIPVPARAIELSGIVRNADGDGLANTTVRVYAPVNGETRKVAEQEADSTGTYQIRINDGAVISAIEYDHPAWQPQVVQGLSGRAGDDHVINKILHNKQGPKQFVRILEQVHEYVELFHLQRELLGFNVPMERVQAALRDRFQDRILAMPDPRRVRFQPQKQKDIVAEMRLEHREILSRELGELFELYGIRATFDLHHSEWNTTYITNGTRMDTIARIDGDAGTNDLVENGRRVPFGILSNITVTRVGAKIVVSGSWSLREGTERGYFRWEIDPKAPNTFTGVWGIDPNLAPLGSWNGKLQ